MKLLICLFLIVMIVEQYNCAPHSSTRNRHRHHYRLQHRPFRQRSSYLPSYGPNGKCRPGYRAWVGVDRAHPWRGFRHCTHCFTHDYRRSSGYGYPSISGYGYRPSFRNCYGYGSRYPTRAHYVPNTTPMDKLLDKTEDKPLTAEKATERSVEKSVEKATEKIEKPVKKSLQNFSNKSLDKPSTNSAGSSLENLSDYSTINQIEDMPSENVFDMASENSFTVIRN